MKPAENVAKAVIEKAIEGSRMLYRLDQSRSVPDFDLHYPDGTVAVVEVTAAVDAPGLEMHAAIRNPRKGGSGIANDQYKKTWQIRPGRGANINRIRVEAEALLAAIEGAGIEHFFGIQDRDLHPAIGRLYTELRVMSGDVIEGSDSSIIRIAPPIDGGAIGGTLVTQAVENEAWKSDNRVKLSVENAAEKHLFVFVDMLNGQIWTPLVHLPPPSDAPNLPAEVTHVWTAGAGPNAGYTVWRAANGSAWQSLGEILIDAT